MPLPKPTLYMLCGKIAAGKSTLAAKLAAADNRVLIAEDEWLAALFSEELNTPKDYQRSAAKLRAAMAPHIVSLLNAGMSVVLDFQANTVESRAWMRGLLDQTDVDHQFHVLMPPDELCLARLQRRNESGLHPFVVTEDQFHQISAYFRPPTPDEGFHLVIHDTHEAKRAQTNHDNHQKRNNRVYGFPCLKTKGHADHSAHIHPERPFLASERRADPPEMPDV